MVTPSEEIEQQMSDAPGRMSRALPLFLAEQVRFACQASVQTLIPWIAEGAGGFVLCGVAWSNDDAVEYVRLGGTKSDYVVVTHLNLQSDPGLWISGFFEQSTENARAISRLPSHPPIPESE